MTKILAILINENLQLEFDHAKPIPQDQLDYLEGMDEKMNRGIRLGDKEIDSPGTKDRVKFVAQELATSLLNDDDKMAVAMCTWLGVRSPDLYQVKISIGEIGITVDLDYETPYEKSAPQPKVVKFHPKLDS
tara:strand:- start:89 stop:484 length:396 start_codon:yes stop_codon:yes gene_type:complete